MEIRTLQYFLMVAREENITRAAEQLHIGQPTLSRQLMQLEDEVGQQLLIRGKRKVELTEAGMLLRRRAEEIISLVDKTEKELWSDQEELSGQINIGAGQFSAVDIMLPKVISSFSKAHPLVTYDIYTGNADLVKERLDQGLLDFGILVEPVEIEKYDFIRLPYKETWGLVVSKNNPLSRKKYITSQDLIGTPLALPNRTAVQSEFTSWYHDDYNKLQIIASGNFITNMISLIEADICCGISVQGAFNQHAMNTICIVPLYPELSTGTVIVWKKHQSMSALMQQFVKEINNALNE
ncbi:MAG: LysR family transcriptional regulator [Erysipelotrichaceae bacterium]|nr:LysR family transcriptional regulator [Erysipelotrichaceae bacterium]